MGKKSNAALKQEQSELPLFNDELKNKFWKSSLFNEIYLKNDLQKKYSEVWDFDEAGPIYTFINDFQNLCVALEDEKFSTWSETETINNSVLGIGMSPKL